MDQPPSRDTRLVGSAKTTLPNIVLVVLDTVRQDFLSGGEDAAPDQPFLDALRRTCYVHPRTIAPSPWTVPSHASLFTGQPSWVHGVHLRGKTRLPSDTSTLGDTLGRRGYRTASFSSNFLISSLTGLDHGFQVWRAGGRQDSFLRGACDQPSRTSLETSPSRLARLTDSGFQEPVQSILARWPSCLGALLRARLGADENMNPPSVSGWIEPQIGRWLERVPPNVPVFVFVNYMDAHEPYIGFPTGYLAGDVRGRPSRRSGRQDWVGWVRGRWIPSEEELRVLRDLYRMTFQSLDRRIDALVRLLRRANRWDNSLFVLTSDHGQSFGEGGILFHNLRTSEALVRVPLWVRTPASLDPPLDSGAWTSLTIVREMIEAFAKSDTDSREFFHREAIPCSEDIPQAVTIADGLATPRVPQSRMNALNRLIVTGYSGSRKLSMDVKSSSFTVVDLKQDPHEQHPLKVSPTGPLSEFCRVLQTVARRVSSSGIGDSVGVAERLASWGYG